MLLRKGQRLLSNICFNDNYYETERLKEDDIEVYPKQDLGKNVWRRSPKHKNTLDEFIITGSKNNISFYKQRLDDINKAQVFII